jgi:hypothetical protein
VPREQPRQRRKTQYELLAGTSTTTAGKLAARTWLESLALTPPAGRPWFVELTLGVDEATPALAFDCQTETRLRMEVFSEEWGVQFCHRGRSSWIRVTDIPFVHGRDDFALSAIMPPLRNIGFLVRSIESEHAMRFDRGLALVRSNVPGAELALRPWLAAL